MSHQSLPSDGASENAPAPPALSWGDGGVPVSTAFQDPYYSREDGLAESRHVFLAANGLPERFRHGFHIAELGFGTGLNMLAAWQAFRRHGSGGSLHYTAFELAPMRRDDMARALSAFDALSGEASALLQAWPPKGGRLELPGLCFQLIPGDARETLPRWEGMADAWFLDGFAPARNPELWEPGLMAQVARHTVPGGSFATYSAAGAVRRALAEAGFAVKRLKGFGRKRHMCAGRLEGA